MAAMRQAIWLTWEKQVRNASMSRALGVPLYEISLPKKRVRRYLEGFWRTVWILKQNSPRIVVVQNPSVVLTTICVLLRRLFQYKLVIDAHFGGVEAYNRNRTFQNVLDWCNGKADLVIVTNPCHAAHIERLGGTAVVCEDPLPDIAQYISETSREKEVLFVCSFDIDEPYNEVFKAAQLLAPEGIRVSISGNYAKVGIVPKNFPWVRFLGYLPTAEFYIALFRARVILDLTNHDNCLVCGGYEAMAAERPLVTSDKEALRCYFSRGTVFTGHEARDISDAIRTAFNQWEVLSNEIRAWKNDAAVDNAQKIGVINSMMERWMDKSSRTEG